MTIHTEKRSVRRRQDCRDEVRTEPVGGGSQVYVRNADDNTIAEGTLGVVCVDNYGREVVTTAGHVAEKSFGGDDRMWQAGQLVGERVAYDAGCDIASYEAQFVRHQPGNVVEQGVSDINGTWDFAGLADETSGWWSEGPDVEFAGMINCHGETTVEETERNDSVVYQVTMADNVTDGGDSGGPYVDEDGTLAALHSGTQGLWVLGNSYGAAGTEALQAISARLN